MDDVLDQLAWIWLFFLFAVLVWSIWAGVIRPVIDRRWPGAVDRVIDRLLPLPARRGGAVPGGHVLAHALLGDPFADLPSFESESSPRPADRLRSADRVIPFTRSAVTSAGEGAGAPIPAASSASPLDFERVLSTALHVDAIARELYLATFALALPGDVEPHRAACVVFEQLPPRVREAYRAAAEVAVLRLDVRAHCYGITEASGVAPNFVKALERYHWAMRHRVSPGFSPSTGGRS